MPSSGSLIYILLSTLTTAAYFIYISQLMRNMPKLSSNFFLCISNYAAAALLVPAWCVMHGSLAVPDFTGETYINAAIAACFLLLARELYFYAYARTDIANITVFSAFTPIYTLVSGFFLLHEVPSARVISGILIVVFSIYYLFMPQENGKTSLRLLQPFRNAFQSMPVFCGFLSTIPTAFGAVFQKKALTQMDAVSFSIYLFMLIGSASLLIELGKPSRCDIAKNLRITFRPAFWISAALLALMHVSFAPVLVSHHSATALALQRCSILFQIVFAYYFLGQKDHFAKRVIVGLCIILGFVLLWEPQ